MGKEENVKVDVVLGEEFKPNNPERAMEILSERVAEGKVPRYLYKYYSADDDEAAAERRYTELIIKNQELRFANAKTFNDPFDGQLVPVVDDTLEEIQERYLAMYRKMERYSRPEATEAEIDAKAVPYAMKSAAAKFVRKDEDNKFGEKWLLRTMFANYKISCFSEKPDNILLWSHYARNHTGICIKFDVLADRSFFRRVWKIKYRRHYPAYNIHRTMLKGVIETMLGTKAKIWKYEKEWRLIKSSEVKSDENGDLITTLYENFKFNKLAIKEIVFGCNASAVFVDRIKQATKDAGLEEVTFKKARVSETEFKLEFDKIS